MFRIKIKERRKEISLSAEQLAEYLGVSPATIYRYENGDIGKIPAEHLMPIATALQTTPAYLMGWEDKFESPEGFDVSKNNLATKIRDLRSLHNLTLEQVARHVGVGKSTVRKWETGDIANMRSDKIAKLAVALQTTPAYLMGWEDEFEFPTGLPYGVALLKDRILYLRKSLGLTQAQFGERIGVKGNTVTTYETGVREPSKSVFMHICRVFNVSEQWLRTGEGAMFVDLLISGDRTLELNDVPFYQEYRELPEDDQETVRQIVHVMRNRRKRNPPQDQPAADE